jgi:hypothetical protein
MRVDEAIVRQFESHRARFYADLAEMQREGDALASRLCSPDVDIKDAARLAGLHERKKLLFAQFLEREENLLDDVLGARLPSRGEGIRSDVDP